MTNITIETDRDDPKLYEWLGDDPNARKIDVDRHDSGAIVAEVETAYALWSLTLAIQNFQRSRHIDSRPNVTLVYGEESVTVAGADRGTIDDFYTLLPRKTS
ncbi:MAG TPA: hypothetical protein H9902_06585 [Candidatus Stackebrandtia faecavium]|nr:hypothetical protein [Candidatus Stackebrandtia faecavium]